MNLLASIKGHNQVQSRILQALKQERLAHALLFSGPSGIGKKKMAWALAQRLLCESHSSCGQCYTCLSVCKKESEHILNIQTELLNLKISDVQPIHSFLSLGTTRFKIVIIDSADKLNLTAANSLLKVIEEPTDKSFFFLISSQPHKLPVTIRSRLQNIRFQALDFDIVKDLTKAEDWMIHACRGRLDRLQEIQASGDIREMSFKLWKAVSQKGLKPYLFKFPAELKKRDQALMVCQYWQQLLRDARWMKIEDQGPIIHLDQKELMESFHCFSALQLDFLIKQSLELERFLKANIDVTACFEHFLMGLQKLWKLS